MIATITILYLVSPITPECDLDRDKGLDSTQKETTITKKKRKYWLYLLSR